MSGRGFSTSPAAFSRDELFVEQRIDSSRRRKRQRTLSFGSDVHEEEEEGVQSEYETTGDLQPRRLSRRISQASGQSFGGLFKTAIAPDDVVENERSRLLAGDAELVVPTADSARAAWKLEGKMLTRYSLPILGTHLLEFSLLIATNVSVGHLSTTALAAASLASMTVNVTTLSIVQGLCTALDTLGSQAAGSEMPELAGLHAQRTTILLACILPFQIAFCWASEIIFLAIGQDPDVSRLACQYLRVLSFGLPGYAVFEVLRRWLQVQGLMGPPAFAVMIVAPLNILLQYVLVWTPVGFGFVGAPLSTVIAFNGMALITGLYCVFRAPRRCWSGFDRRALSHIGPNLRLGFAGILAVSSEWWAFEALGLGASYLGPLDLAAQSVILTTAGTVYQVPYALSVGAAVRIGNLLGGERPDVARVTVRASVVGGLCLGLFNSSMLLIFRDHIGQIFTSDVEVVSRVAQAMHWVALFQIFDAISGVCAGLLRGAGRAPLGATVNLCAYYIVGLPLAFAFAFPLNFGLQGLWMGIALALTVSAFLVSIITLRLDLVKEVQRARSRMA